MAERQPDSTGQQGRDAVGEAWRDALGGAAYGEADAGSFRRRFRQSPYIRLMTEYARLPDSSLVLEPGCGSGKFSMAFAALGHRVIALDYLEAVLRGVRQSSSRQPETALHAWCQGSLESLPFVDEAFDLVLNEGVIEHWLNDGERRAVLGEMARVVRPGGTVAVVVPNGVHPMISRWEERVAAYTSSPPMCHYSGAMLGADLAAVGLQDVDVDGIYAWRSWVRLRPWRKLYLVAALLDRLAPLPRRRRVAWGINLIGMGRKP